MSDVYSSVGDARPSYSAFKFHPTSTFDFELGQVIPILRMDCIPGDRLRFENGINIQFMPLVAPLKHNITAYVNYFFVPYRILWEDWVTFITGGKDGTEADDLELPSWSFGHGFDELRDILTSKYTYWDYVGNPIFPADYVDRLISSLETNFDFRDWLISSLPHRLDLMAYNMIYNEYYRDQNVMDERDLWDYSIFSQCWNKDYFTSALPWQQRGIPPRVPIGQGASSENTFIPLSVITAGFESDDNTFVSHVEHLPNFLIRRGDGGYFSGSQIKGFLQNDVGGGTTSMITLPYDPSDPNTSRRALKNEFVTSVPSNMAKVYSQDLVIKASDLVTDGFSISITDLRLASSLQRWMERNARTGVRYVEFLKGHYNVTLPDSTAQRPILLGSTSQDIIVSDVFQTSQTSDTSSLGTLAGNASSASFAKGPEFHCLEYGCVLALLSVVPAPSYMSQGLNKSWTRKTRFDFAFPEFMHLSECPIKNSEIYWNPSPDSYLMNEEVFGYQSAWDEYRQMPSYVAGAVRDTMDAWTLSRKFGSQPHLNGDFLQIDGKSPDMKRIFAVSDEPAMICYAYNQVDALRPIPYISEPMLIA